MTESKSSQGKTQNGATIMKRFMRKTALVLVTACALVASTGASGTTAVAAAAAAPTQQRQVAVTAPVETSAVALRRVRCTDHDKRGIRYTTDGRPSYRVAARCESKKWAAAATGVGLVTLTATMCGMVAALGSPVSGAVCATIVAATSVTLLVFVREVREDSRTCFAVIRNWRLGAPLITIKDCRFRRGAVPRMVSP